MLQTFKLASRDTKTVKLLHDIGFSPAEAKAFVISRRSAMREARIALMKSGASIEETICQLAAGYLNIYNKHGEYGEAAILSQNLNWYFIEAKAENRIREEFYETYYEYLVVYSRGL
jgi:hypothetical protein